MKCKHHPEYKPESGEPTGTIQKYETNQLLQIVPCPYCWKVYAHHLCNLINEEDIEAFHYTDRIEELEKHLESYKSAQGHHLHQLGLYEARERKLEKQLAETQQKHISGYWACSKCDNIEFFEREVKCWKCGKGEMLYQDKSMLRDFIRQSTEAFRKLKEAEKREVALRVAFTEYRIHVGRCAPLTWASVNKVEYIELAHKWEEEWKVLDDKARAALAGE